MCEYELRIFAHPSFSGKVAGLCGHFNMFDQDDFAGKDGTTYYLQESTNTADPAFLESWIVKLYYLLLRFTKID